jgi:glycosyltransferase involved in cell wall biosynthesis
MARRLAYITHSLPAPADSGSLLRSVRLAAAAARLGPVTLYCRTTEKALADAAGKDALRAFGDIRSEIYAPDEYAKIARIFDPESIACWSARDSRLAARLAEDHRRNPYDMVVCQQIMTANVALGVPGLPMVLDEHNIESAAFRQVLSGLGKKGHVNPEDGQRVVAHEEEAWKRAALVTCPTAADALHIEARGGQRPRVIPNGTDVESLPFTAPSARRADQILFVGAYFWPPNARAAHFLVKEVLPRVRAEIPAASLTLCGKSPGIDVALLRREGVHVTGTVPSVAPYLEQAAVYANPLFEGTGSSLKCLEALAAGVPLISTAVGVRGYPLTPGRQYLVAETVEEFASAILAVLRNRQNYDDMAHAGREVAEQFSWRIVGDLFVAALSDAARSDSIMPG